MTAYLTDQLDSTALLAFSNQMALAANAAELNDLIGQTLKAYFSTDDYRIVTGSGLAYGDVPANKQFESGSSFFKQVLQSDVPLSFSHQDMNLPGVSGIRQITAYKLNLKDRNVGVLWLLFKNAEKVFDRKRYQSLMDISFQIAIVLDQKIANESRLKEINAYQQERQYLQQEVSSTYAYGEIIGCGSEMTAVYAQVAQVAFANSTVLISGETGTGKELIARAIHQASPRKDKLMIKVNCAAIPESLIESELFGHEKGSFTGATERRIGKFELAHNGTLFLDEIGEMPVDLQVKLLRAIQEKEIERIGGRGVIKINVRIIAATNRDLYQEVQNGNFRNDLYYRLNVFPINMPPLRERKEDIPDLAHHFIHRFARNTGKKVTKIAAGAMKELIAYDWPGNVRELEHLLERSLLNAATDVIREVYLPGLNAKAQKIATEHTYIKTSLENERDHILFVLKKCKGKVYGKGGAAQLLDMHVSTLNSRIRKLNIKKEHVFS